MRYKKAHNFSVWQVNIALLESPPKLSFSFVSTSIPYYILGSDPIDLFFSFIMQDEIMIMMERIFIIVYLPY